jgi:fumarate hydratase, class I
VEPKILEKNLLELIRRTSTIMPPDVVAALHAGYKREKAGTPSKSALKTMITSLELSGRESLPLCQDTGVLVWHIHYPDGSNLLPVTNLIHNAVIKATELSYLRPNSVDILTGKNSGNNVGPGSPILNFHAWKKKEWEFDLLLKGGGCENCGAQYKIPDPSINASRDLEGAYKCIMDAVWKAQGKGCAPGVICACIGGSRDTGMAEAKRLSWLKLDEKNPVPELAKLEERIYKDSNKLGIGPLGLGGKTTVLGVKVTTLNRHPATFYVSVNYICWSTRRSSMILKGNKVTYQI